MDQTEFELFAKVDEDGFVALVCPTAYVGYVNEDWTLDQVVERFLEQMNAQALFIAHPGPDSAGAALRISNSPSPTTASREASSFLRVDDDGLWLTDYTQLTMAAQFADERPVTRQHAQLPIPAGVYQVTLRQFASFPELELVIQRAGASEHPALIEAIPWLE